MVESGAGSARKASQAAVQVVTRCRCLVHGGDILAAESIEARAKKLQAVKVPLHVAGACAAAVPAIDRRLRLYHYSHTLVQRVCNSKAVVAR